jgi:DHA1 family bicyclomycin/chloramphenicol resistance-like MFS transporter
MQRNSLRLLLILGALAALAPLTINMYLPAFPNVVKDLGTDMRHVQLTLAAFLAGLAIGQPLYGSISDLYGRKPPLYAGLLLFVLGSVGCALALNVETLIVFRLLQALGACVGLVIPVAIVRDLFKEELMARMLSLQLLITGLATILAPLAGSQVLAWLGWRAMFWLLAAFGVICLAAVTLVLPESRTVNPTTSLRLGNVLRSYGQILSDRRFVGYGLSGAAVQTAMFVYITASPFVFIELYKVSASSYGWLFGLNALGLVAASQLNARLLSRFRSEILLTRASITQVVLGVWLLLVAVIPVGGLIGLLVPLFGIIGSMGFVQPNIITGAMADQAQRAASASAVIGFLRFGMASIGGILTCALFDGTARPMALLIAAFCLLSLLIRRVLVSQALAPVH